MLEGLFASLQPLAVALDEVPSKGVATLCAVGAFVATLPHWRTPQRELDEAVVGSEARLASQIARDTLKNTLLLGAITTLVVMWDAHWLSWAWLVLAGLFALVDLPSTVLSVAFSPAAIVRGPGALALSFLSASVRLAGFLALAACVALTYASLRA